MDIYKAFLKDLINVGYSFTSEFKNYIKDNINSDYLNFSSEFIHYLPTNQNLLKAKNTFKIMKHSSYNRVYIDILLIINYNRPGFLNLNEYLEKLYKKYFPNIVYIYPDDVKKDNPSIISCNISKKGYYSYECIKYVYEKFPNYKGYLYINDDNYMKIWELENFGFSVPWFYIYNETEIDKNNERCKNIFKICDSNLEYKRNYIQFFGAYKLYGGLTDFYYIPNKYIMNFIELAQKMYAENVFLE